MRLLCLGVIAMILQYANLPEDDSEDEVTRTIYSNAFDNEYISDILLSDLMKSPAWQDNADNPPISARRAIQLAGQMRRTLFKDNEDYHWQLYAAEIGFGRNRRCWWDVHFLARSTTGGSGVPDDLHVIVLMDGTVLKPKVSSKKAGE